VLPDAFAHTGDDGERRLAIAMEKPLLSAIGSVASRHSDLFGELLAPTIRAAVGKALSEALAAIIERFNYVLERSLSLRSLGWRIEALRTGQPFAEVALARTLQYRVEQVFLIHTQTSLVLQHVVDASAGIKPPDQIAAMLSAIDTFAQEAFAPDRGGHLDRFELGELVVWVSRDASFTLAAVTRGSITRAFSVELEELRERLRVEHVDALEGFRGDVRPFDRARPELESLLRVERKRPPHRAEAVLTAIAVTAVLGVVGLTWRAHALAAEDASERKAAIEALRAEPGIVLTEVDWKGGHGKILGLGDPLAGAPETILARHGISDATMQLTPFVSLDPRLVERRIERIVAPPAGVRLSFEDRSARVRGVAPAAWIAEARLLSRTIPGLEHWDDHALRTTESIDAIAASIERVTIPFAVGRAAIEPELDGRLVYAADVARHGLRVTDEAGLGMCLQVTGHADPAGTNERNATISQERADVVAARLAELGVDRTRLRPAGAGAGNVRSATLRLAECGGAQ
jgi:OOP family OmpA-OmpF porin